MYNSINFIINGIYKNIERGNYYKVLLNGIHTKTDEKVVVYQSLEDLESPDVLVEPYDTFVGRFIHIPDNKINRVFKIYFKMDGSREGIFEDVEYSNTLKNAYTSFKNRVGVNGYMIEDTINGRFSILHINESFLFIPQ